MPLLAIVRHGKYDGHGDDGDPLSVEGHEQMEKVRKIMDAHTCRTFNVEQAYGVKRLTFSFSSATRALESSFRLKGAGDVVVKELFLTERYEIGQRDPVAIAEDILGLMNYYQAKVGFVVAHGDMPAVLSETLVKMATGQQWDLGSPDKGHGYLVDTDTGHVMALNPAGLHGIPPPNPAPKRVSEETAPGITASQKAVMGPSGNLFDEDNDDDIPF